MPRHFPPRRFPRKPKREQLTIRVVYTLEFPHGAEDSAKFDDMLDYLDGHLERCAKSFTARSPMAGMDLFLESIDW